MTTMTSLPLKSRIMASFAGIFLAGVVLLEGIGLVGLPWIGIRGDIPATRERVLQVLNITADDRQMLLEQWLSDRRADVEHLAGNGMLQQHLASVSATFASERQRGTLDAGFWQRHKQSPAYLALEKALDSFSSGPYELAGFFDPATGFLIAGDRRSAVGVKLSEYPDFRRALSTDIPESVFFVTRPLRGELLLVFSHECRIDNPVAGQPPIRLVALLGVRPASIPLSRPSNEHGQTVKTLLFDQEQRLLSRLRPGHAGAEPGQNPDERVNSRIAQLAATGSEGTISAPDHRGVAVLAAFRHLPISTSEGWGLIVQQDEEEVFGLILQRLWQRIPFALGILLLMLLAVRWLSDKLARPIVDLAATAKQLEKGNLAARSNIRRGDELGELATGFDALAERIAAWHESMQKAVDDRTRQLQHSNQLYSLLSRSSRAIVECRHAGDLFVRLCQDAIVFGGLRLAWIGQIDQDSGLVSPVACCGDDSGFLQDFSASGILLADERCPVARAIREQQAIWCQDLANDPLGCSWFDAAEQAGLKSMGALPLQTHGRVVAVLALFSDQLRSFDPQAEELLGKLATDIGFALEHYAGEAERKQMELTLRRSEARFHGIFNQIEDGIVLADFSHQTVESANPAFLRMCGLPAEAVIGHPLVDLHPVEARERVIENFALLGERHKTFVESIPILRADGSLFNADILATMIELDGRPLVCGVIRDITERERITEELRRHREHLEEIVRERTAELTTALEAARVADLTKDAFLANISHELRTPLNAIMGFAQLAHSTGTDPRQRDYLAKITNAARSLSKIINDLLDLSKIAAGYMEFESLPFSPANLIERCESMMAHQAAVKGLQFGVRVDPEIPACLLGDPHRIEQILLNLLSNAIKYTPAGRVDLRVSVVERTAQRLCLQLEIEDTGIGIDISEQDRLFKPFSQVDVSMTRKYGGTGLGLVISKQLAEMMGGDIHVRSRKGEGSVFQAHFWLGLPTDIDPAAETPPDAASPAIRYHDARALIVEDQAINQLIIEEILQGVGIDTVLAKNGLEALEILDRLPANAFDLVLMDIQMPLMDGLTATRRIREREPLRHLPIIALTAHNMAHEQEASREAGMDDHLAKPFEMDALYAALSRWIAREKQHPVASLVHPNALPPDRPAIDGLNWEQGLTYFAGKEERYLHWLRIFADNAPADAGAIAGQLAAGEPAAAAERTHALKGRLGMLGMTALHSLATDLHRALSGQEGGSTPVTELAERLRQGIVDMARALQTHLVFPAVRPALPVEAGEGLVTPPELAKIVALLERCDGASADAIADCLAGCPDPAWISRLQEALRLARRFDFSSAARSLMT